VEFAGLDGSDGVGVCLVPDCLGWEDGGPEWGCVAEVVGAICVCGRGVACA
jgi:hypothetical protein